MLLEAAMSELREDIADGGLVQLPHNHIQSNRFSGENPSHSNVSDYHITSESVEEVSPLQDNPHKKALAVQPRSNVGSSVTNLADCPNNIAVNPHADDNMDNHEAISLLQEDNEFVSRVLNREPSNLGESSRFGSYRSTAAVAAIGVPFQWEAQPGKSKSPSIKEEEEELPPLSLPPVRGLTLVAPAHIPASHMSPSSSAAPSPRSLTGKVKNLIINHVKKPSMDHFTSILETQLKSPSRKSPHRSKRERKNSSLCASEYSSMQSGSVSTSPYIYSGPFKNGYNMQKNEESYGPRASLNSSSDHCSSPYYFSPLSNTSSLMSQGIMSPRASVAQSSTGSIISNSHSHVLYPGGSHSSSRDSDSSISSVNSNIPGNAAANGPAMLANCLLTITSMSDDHLPPVESENGDQNGSNSLSFASPEMESVDEGLLTGADVYSMDSKPETSMEDFINRGGPSMHRSFSTSRVTFVDDVYRKPPPKSKYYSGQLSNLSNYPSSKQEPLQYTSKLDVLFPLKRPNGMEFTVQYADQSEDQSPDDKQSYVDALDRSLDCSVMTDNEELNSMVQSIMNDQKRKDRPAHEVVMEANDENGFAYSPVASAFVFSPKKGASQNAPAATHYFKPSTRANISNNASNGSLNGVHNLGQPKSILKKTYSQELNRTASFNVKRGTYDDLAASTMQAQQKSFSQSGPLQQKSDATSSWRLAYVAQPKSLNNSSSQKISSVLLRFAEAEEKLYNSNKRHNGGIRSPAACMQPMCSFLGRALLCRSKLTSHAAGPLRT